MSAANMATNRFLYQISQELARFNSGLLGFFRCPVCLRDLPVKNFGIGDVDCAISEEHIIPDSVGGKQTTFLCKRCNSTFGTRQTKWLSEWVEINEGGAPFYTNPKKQRARISTNGLSLNGSLKLAEDGTIEFYTDRRRSNPNNFNAHWKAYPLGSGLPTSCAVKACCRAVFM